MAELCLPYGLHRNDVEQLTTLVKSQKLLKTNDYLFAQGSDCQHLYAVKSGSFRSFILNADGLEQTIGFYFPGEIMGLDALQNGQFNCSTIALETGSVCEVPISQLNELCSKIPGLQMQMLRILGKEIASDHEKILLLGHRTARERVVTFLLMLSRRYGALGFSATTFNLSMSRQDMANFLGLTIETVSRQLTELNKQGIIAVKQRSVQIYNMALLTSIVEPCLNH